jgi:NADPH:quinone reductase-like Zn-dependent oxidoreductase
MRAVVFDEFGGPEVLRLTDVEEPFPGPGQVKIEVRAAGVNPADGKLRDGSLRIRRTETLPAIPGFEAAGVVVEVGEGVTALMIGDEVFGFTVSGSHAAYALARTVARKPADLGWAEAAALPTATEAADRVLDLLEVADGDTLLINGAAGAVGSAGVQLAGLRGATVIGTASPVNHDYLRTLGAIPVAYGDGLVDRVGAAAPDGVDAVFDVAGKGALPAAIELRGGTTDRIVTIADPAADDYGVTFSSTSRRSADALARWAELAVTDRLRVTIAGTYPFADAGDAAGRVETGHGRGKIVLVP